MIKTNMGKSICVGQSTEKLNKWYLVLLFFILHNLFTTVAQANGVSEEQARASTTVPTCNNGLCRTPAKVLWLAGDGYGLYYTNPLDTLVNYKINGTPLPLFCKAIEGNFIGIVLAVDIPKSFINGVKYDTLYYGNCGTTIYSNGQDDYRGSARIHPICPNAYNRAITRINNELTDTCEAKFTPPTLNAPPPPKRLGPQPHLTCNPINISTGNKYLAQTDYATSGNYPFSVQRTYNSQQYEDAGIGVNWQHNWLGYAVVTASATQMHAKRPDGKTYVFNLTNNVWQSDTDITDKLERLSDTSGALTGWRYALPDGVVETYNANGKLQSLSNRDSFNWTLSYVDDTMSVTDALGRSLKFKDDGGGNRIVILPDGSNLKYMRNTTSNVLNAVIYPDTKTKAYLYDNTIFNYALTGILDENGSRFATYRYDAAGRAYDEELAPALGASLGQPIERNNLVYNIDGSGNPTSTVVTDSRGATRTYNFTTILGVVKSTGQSQPAGAGCAASAAALTYDVNGNIASRTDFKGNKTTYAYDMARNLETSRTEGLSSTNTVTSATRTITTSYHPTWRLPLVITEYNGGTSNLSDGSGTPTGTALRSTSTVYDAKGNITSITEADPVRSTSRTTTMTYTYSTAVPGLMLTKVIDGPRTDVNDLTTYTYYPHDATCTPSSATPIIDPITNTSPANLGCRGQLQSMSNALNQTSSYDRYNHHGQVEQMTDANGLVTTSTYDLRQRLLSRTAGTETTTLVYDNVGQVTQLTLPDASQLNYTYDAAHRLTDVQDNLGNKVHYTLDTEGNRTNETTTDPTNALTKTLTRSYDALNRLQQVTGVE